jgi:Aspartyl protease
MAEFPLMISLPYAQDGASVSFPGAVNGEPVTFALDTGISGVVIGTDDAARLGLTEGAHPVVSLDLFAWDDVPVTTGSSGSAIGLAFLLENSDQVAFQAATSQLTIFHNGRKPGRILP